MKSTLFQQGILLSSSIAQNILENKGGNCHGGAKAIGPFSNVLGKEGKDIIQERETDMPKGHMGSETLSIA